MRLKENTETASGLNTSFVNTDTNRIISLEQAIKGINNNNPNYDGYHVAHRGNTEYVRSNPDRSSKNNIEK